MIDNIRKEDINLVYHIYSSIIEKYKDDDISPLLQYGYQKSIVQMIKLMEKTQYYIEYKGIKIDIFLFPLMKYLLDNDYKIKSCSYYDSICNYCHIVFTSLDDGLYFLDKIINKRNLLYRRVENSLNYNLIGKWLYDIKPYKTKNNIIDFEFTIYIPNYDVNLLYKMTINKDNKDNDKIKNSYSKFSLFKKTKIELINYLNKINKIKSDNNNIIINKIFNNSYNYVHKLLLNYDTNKILFKFGKSTYKINRKLVNIVKELLINEFEINDDECYYDNEYKNECCLSFPFYAHADEFIFMITHKYEQDDLYKKIFNLIETDRWIYEICVIDINMRNRGSKPDYFPSINIKFSISDLDLITKRLVNFKKNKFN